MKLIINREGELKNKFFCLIPSGMRFLTDSTVTEFFRLVDLGSTDISHRVRTLKFELLDRLQPFHLNFRSNESFEMIIELKSLASKFDWVLNRTPLKAWNAKKRGLPSSVILWVAFQTTTYCFRIKNRSPQKNVNSLQMGRRVQSFWTMRGIRFLFMRSLSS